MSKRFFTNEGENTLLKKFAGARFRKTASAPFVARHPSFSSFRAISRAILNL